MSQICQAIVDTIIDLTIPVATVYSDVIGDLELDVLTRPSVRHTRLLYIINTEISKMMSFIQPITNLLAALRDHDIEAETGLLEDPKSLGDALRDPSKGVIITPLTHTYLGDVLDHCVLISESLEQVKSSANGLIDLIFNTISTSQNQSMKQLTTVTILFLPLTFITGFFGQNFEPFPQLQQEGIDYL